MSETPHLRAVEEGEKPSIPVSGPKRFKLSAHQWAHMNDGLRPYTQQAGGTVIGDEVLQFHPDTVEQALGMTKILHGVIAGTPSSYSGMTVSHIEFSGEDPKDTRPTIYFPGVLAPDEISVKADRAMAEANLMLEAVQSPLRFPD